MGSWPTPPWSVADAAAALDHATAQIKAGEVAQVLAVAALCDLHRVDETNLFDGAERWIQGGADGTPQVGEFVTGEIACLLETSIGSAVGMIARVLNLRHRHPHLWQLVCAGVVRFWAASKIVDACATAGLDHTACQQVDAWCATALAFQPWGRVLGQVEHWILLADPALAAERARLKAATRYLRIDAISDGHCDLTGRLDAIDGILFDQALDSIAGTLPDGDADTRRAAAVGVLAKQALGQDTLPTGSGGHHDIDPTHATTGRDPGDTPTDAGAAGSSADAGRGPWSDVAPGSSGVAGSGDDGSRRQTPRRRAELVVHVNASDLADPSGGTIRIERYGHLLGDRLTELLAGSRVTCRPILDPNTIQPTDAYRVPDLMRQVLNDRNPYDVFPWGTRHAAACDADHTTPYDPTLPAGHGQTNLANLGPTARFGHRLRTHGGWQVTQPEPGCYVWRSRLGYSYLVTATGSITIARPAPTVHDWWRQEPPDHEPPEPPPDPDLDIAPAREGPQPPLLE